MGLSSLWRPQMSGIVLTVQYDGYPYPLTTDNNPTRTVRERGRHPPPSKLPLTMAGSPRSVWGCVCPDCHRPPGARPSRSSSRRQPGWKERSGAYSSIRTDINDYKLADALPCPHQKTLALAETPTRLKAMEDPLQERLSNWGYAVCTAAIRAHVDKGITAPNDFPYPKQGVG